MLHFDVSLAPEAPLDLLDTAKGVARSATFPKRGNPEEVKLIAEDKVDVVIGSTITPNSLAMIDVAAENETPMISMAANARIGKGSRTTFGVHAWDAWILLERAIPAAAKRAKPGTKEFRKALRDALESEKNVLATHGVFNMTAADHLGLDQRARVMARIDNGTWKLISP